MGEEDFQANRSRFPRPPLLFSSDPHELVSWVKKISRLIGHGSPGLPSLPLPDSAASGGGIGEWESCGVVGVSSTVSFTHEASSWGSRCGVAGVSSTVSFTHEASSWGSRCGVAGVSSTVSFTHEASSWGSRCGVAGVSSTVSFTHEASSWGSRMVALPPLARQSHSPTRQARGGRRLSRCRR